MSETDKIMEEYEKNHRLDKRLAVLDQYYLMHVTNKAFSDYFGNLSFGCMTEIIHPDDREEFEAFIDNYDGKQIESRIFRFQAAGGDYRHNILILLSMLEGSQGRNTNIEMYDVHSTLNVNKLLSGEVNMFRTLLGLSEEYTFMYDRDDNIFHMYHYSEGSREVVFKEDIDEWKNRMLEEKYVVEKDEAMFRNMVTEIKTYVQVFSAKISTSMMTRNKVSEKVKFIGTVYFDDNGHSKVVGRALVGDAASNQHKQVLEMVEGLTYDPLTQVLNKKAITEYAEKLIKEATDSKIVVTILDLDHFKQVNDNYGHIYGDKILARAGRKLKEIVGEDGVVGRIGGDEFLIIFNNIGDEHLLRGILRAIRTQIKWEFAKDFEDLIITCSIGAATFPDNSREYEELFKKADYCLYIAKEKGRDRYVFFRDDVHGQSYQDSLNKTVEKGAINNGREMKELRYISNMMVGFATDKRRAIKNMLKHMFEAYRLDNISVYYGSNMKRTYNQGEPLLDTDNATYVFDENFVKILGEKNLAEVGFVSRVADLAPVFYEAMKKRRVCSTLQCIIGTPDDIQGLLTLNRCKESSQWAEYETECASIVASLLTYMAEENIML